MAITWTDFASGDLLSTIRGKLNAFSNSVVTAVNTNTTNIANNTANILTNTSDIGTNTANILTNTINLAALEEFHTYDYIKGTGITVTNDVYEEVARLTTPSRDAGVYKLSQSMLYSLNSTTTSAYFRFSTNGGSTWSEIRREPKDNTDVLPSAYTSTIAHTGGIFDLIIQSRKENAADILTISSIDVIFERKA